MSVGELSRLGNCPGWGTVRWGNVLVGEVSVGELSLLGKCPVGEMSGWGNVSVGEVSRLGKCPLGKCPVGEMSGHHRVFPPILLSFTPWHKSAAIRFWQSVSPSVLLEKEKILSSLLWDWLGPIFRKDYAVAFFFPLFFFFCAFPSTDHKIRHDRKIVLIITLIILFLNLIIIKIIL